VNGRTSPGTIAQSFDSRQLDTSLSPENASLADWLMRPIIFETPNRLTDVSAWHTHIPFAFWIVDAIKPAVFVELGTHKGDSYCAFCQAVEVLSLPTRCWAIDTWEGDEHSGRYGNEVFQELQAYHDSRYARFSTLLRTTFDEALSRFEDRSIDLLHIDGLHTYEAVKHDFEGWLPKLSRRGVVLLHDVNVRDRGFEVWRLWEELSRVYPTFVFPHGHGLGLVAAGIDIPERLRSLISSNSHSAEQVRAVFCRLGEAVTATSNRAHQIRSLEAALQQREVDLVATNRRLQSYHYLLKQQQQQWQVLQHSSAWKLVQLFWSWNMRLFPPGTRRRLVYSKTVGSLGRWLVGNGSFGKPAANAVDATLWGRSPSAAGSQDARAGDIALNCEEPAEGQCCAGIVPIQGWATSKCGIQKVDIRVDGKLLGSARHGRARRDVAKDYPKFPDSQKSGFLYFWNTKAFADGPHSIVVSALAKDGTDAQQTVAVIVDHKLPETAYDWWLASNEPNPTELEKMGRESEQFTYQPLISIIVPVYKTPLHLLREAIESVRKQVYRKWELCICDDGSDTAEISATLNEYAAQEPQIKLIETARNEGIAAASNRALSLATGAFVAFLDHDDTLAPDALYWLVKLLQDERDADLIYSDEDKIDISGKRIDPFFKPDWSPDLLLSMNYMCHFLVARRELVHQVGGLRSEFDGSQDYDLILRLIERTSKIHHIPRVLYHWRVSPNSTALGPEVKPGAHIAAQKAISEYLSRKGLSGRVERADPPGRWRVRYDVVHPPKVSVVLPTGGRLELLRTCLQTLVSKTEYPDYEILVVDNSRANAVQDFLAGFTPSNIHLSHIDCRYRVFNYSALNNLAVKRASGRLVLFLNDDTEITAPDWLLAMVEHGQRREVGAVGAKLLYPSGQIQHAGVVMGLYELTAHPFKNFPGHFDQDDAYFSFPHVIRNCSAVTAACMLTKRDLFLTLGGFDERKLPFAFQDVDYCLRVSEAGYSIVYTPYAVLVHHESVTKDGTVKPREARYLRRKWADVIARDPFYSPHLTRKADNYTLNI